MHPRDLDDAHEIWPRMWLGGAPQMQLDPSVVVICAATSFATPNPEGINIHIDMRDVEGDIPDRRALDELVQQAHPWVEGGRTTFWHCQAGINRSSFVLGYYMCSVHGLSANDAVARIRRRRHHSYLMPLFNRSFVHALQRWFP